MNTDGLARQYGSLTPAERLSLIMAASKRGDEQECQRLATSAPSLICRCPHHFALANAFRELCAMHCTTVLGLFAMYLYGIGEARATDGEEAEQLLDVSRWFGYMLKVNLAGWQQFYAGLNFDADPFTGGLHGEPVLDLAARLAEQGAFTAEEALACMLRHDLKATAATTAEGVAADLRKALDVRTARWGG
jgi:hypothetical protein